MADEETHEETQETEEVKTRLIKDTKHTRGYAVFNKEDIEALGLDWETTTSKDLNDKVRADLGLPEKVRTSAMKAEIDEAREKLGLSEDATAKEVMTALRKKAKI